MFSEPKRKLNFSEIEKYRLPIYCRKGKEKYVYFYVLDPESVMDGSPRLRRVRKKFNYIHNKKERDEAALRFRDEVAIKLKQGWNPLIQESGKKGFAIISTVLDRYEHYIKKLHKDNVMKPKTVTDYMSRLRTLSAYNDQLEQKIVYAYQFDRNYIEGFLEWVYVDKDTSPRTRNNYLRWVSSLCTYLYNNGYTTANSAERIPLLREDDKKRKTLTKQDLKKLKEYLEIRNSDFLLACLVHYYTLIRPCEMCSIRIDDINLAEQTIFVSKDISKNRKDAKVTLPAKVIHMMLDKKVFSYPGNFYLFGRHFTPSEHKSDARIFREEWAKVREALQWPDCYQFYSLKDTGITDAIDRVGLTIAKDQARHSSVVTTNKYVRKEQLKAHPELKNYEGNL